jgi:hypothetical protein
MLSEYEGNEIYEKLRIILYIVKLKGVLWRFFEGFIHGCDNKYLNICEISKQYLSRLSLEWI